MKKFLSIFLASLMMVVLTACGNTTSNTPNTSSSSNESNKEQFTTNKKPNTKDVNIINVKSIDELDEKLETEIDNTVAALTAESEKLNKDINTFDKYKKNSNKIEDFYEKIVKTNRDLCIRLCEYSLSYAEKIISSDMDSDDKYDELDEIYENVYNDAGDEIYEQIYDGILDDLYKNYYDGILDDAYDTIPYRDWVDARSQEYDWWTDARSDVYDDWTDIRSDIYSFWSDVKGKIYNNEVDKAKEKIERFRKRIIKLKNKD